MSKINPFKPNSPVNPGMFVGRVGEVFRLDSHLLQTRASHPTNFMIVGERGIGKSSLLLYLKYAAEGHIPINGDELHFLVVYTDIDQGTTQLGLVKKIELGIRRELDKTEPAHQFMNTAWAFIQRIEAAGVRIHPEEATTSDELLLEQFAYTLAEVVQRVCDPAEAATLFNAKYDGLLILIDEADNASPALQLGAFAKLLLERLQRQGCQRVMIGLAGLTELREVLVASHLSSLRLFDELRLERLTRAEVGDVIDRCLETANKENDSPTSITENGKSMLASLSEGYPHFVQQFGFSAFATDSDDKIDDDDVLTGAFQKGGALELIGDRYYRDDFYNKIQAESYRQVLRIMADKQDSWITKREIKQQFKGSEGVLNNALKALRDRHVIMPKEGQPGIYRLQHKGFAFWIKLYTSDRSKISASLQAQDDTQDISPKNDSDSGSEFKGSKSPAA